MKSCEKTDEEQNGLWMYTIFNKDVIKEKTEQWTKEAEEAGMTLPEYLESINPLNDNRMTKEEAINLLMQVNKILVNNNSWLENTHEPLNVAFGMAIKALEQEPLTDTEQRIFLAAMGREEKICREADEKFPYKMPYEESMVSVCRRIERKVKKALWE